MRRITLAMPMAVLAWVFPMATALVLNETFHVRESCIPNPAIRKRFRLRVLGDVYRNGFGVAQDYQRAVMLYTKSCELDWNMATGAQR